MASNIVRRCEQREPKRRQVFFDEHIGSGARQTNGNVRLTRGHIHHPILSYQLKINVGVLLAEREQRSGQCLSHSIRHTDPQCPSKNGLIAAQRIQTMLKPFG